MGFRGIIGWIRGRGRKEEEEEDPQVDFARGLMEKEMMRDIEEFLTYEPPKVIPRRRRIIYISPTEYGLRCVEEKKIFSKKIGVKKVDFRVFLLPKYPKKYFICFKCRKSFSGIHLGTKTKEKCVFLCPSCFKSYPDWDSELEAIKRRRLK